MTDYTSVWRTGTAAAATTAPGTPPAYGLALDFGQQWMSPQQFFSMARDLAAYRQEDLIKQAEAGVPESLHALELQRARNFAQYGQFKLDSEIRRYSDALDFHQEEDRTGISGAIQPLENALGAIGSLFSTTAANIGGGIRETYGRASIDPTEVATFEDYKRKGGLLSEEEFNSFDAATRNALHGGARFQATAGAQMLGTGLEYAHRGFTTPLAMIHQSASQNPNNVPFNLSNVMNPMWFDGSRWAQAWRESNGTAPGQEAISALLTPYASDEQLDHLRRNSALFQTAALGVDFALGWHLDPTVIAGKGLGGTARVIRNEMPLNEKSAAFKGITERMQREQITVRGPVGKYADWRAERMFAARNPVNELARKYDFAEFANIMNRNLGKRSTGKTPAMWALHYAVNKGDDALVDLTWQAVHGDPKAWAQIRAMNEATPDELKKFAPNAQHFLDALNATKTRVKALEDEVDALSALVPEDAGLEGLFDWTHHTPAAKKQLELDEATNTLNKYEEYGTWLDLLGPDGTSLLSGVRGPRSYQRRFFKAGPYGHAHTAVKVVRGTWLQKTATVSAHDLNSGRQAIDRLSSEWDHHYGYLDPEARASAQNAWATAATADERIAVIRDFEDTQLPRAISSKFDISEDVARALIHRIREKQNQTKRGVLRGQGSIYEGGPSLAQRLRDPEDYSVQFEASAGDTVTISMMDGRQHKVTIDGLPKEALEPWPAPWDPTQKANYYTPLDQRELFYLLKRDEDVIGEIGAGERLGIDAMEFIDTWATRFYSMWKPLQLWRLGWPQRVLMDEMARATAIYGPMYLINGPGGEAVRTGARNIPAHVKKYIDYKRHGHVDIGGGLASIEKAATNPWTREAEITNALQLPEYHWPKYDHSRRVSIDKANVEWGQWLRAQAADDMLPTREFAPAKEHPMGKVYRDWMSTVREGDAPFAVFDPVTGLRIRKGRVVPIEDPQLLHQLTESTDLYGPEFRGALGWHEKNAELLSNSGYRIIVHKDGKVGVARVFNKRGEFRKALDFQKVAHYQFPGTPMWNLEDLASPALISDVLPPSPTMRQILDDELRTIKEDEFKESITPSDFNAILDDGYSRLEKLLTKKEFGTGTIVQMKDGVRVEYPDVFGGHDGALTKALISSNKAIDYVSQGHGSGMDLYHHQAMGHVAIQPPRMTGAEKKFLQRGSVEHKQAVLYFHRYADLLNNQIAHSPIWSKMLKGQSDDEIIAWLDTPEGARAVREAKPESWAKEQWVLEHRQKLDYYVPNAPLQRVLGKRQVTPSEINKSIPEDRLPEIFGPDIEVVNRNSPTGRTLSGIATHIWRSLGTLPIDSLSRHPFAKAAYNQKMQSLVRTTNAKWLDDETIRRYTNIAHEYARNQVKRHLWDLTEQTHFTDAIRFVAPFWAAQQEAIVKWLRIISDRPETVARVFMGQQAVYNNFAVIDENGEPVNRLAADKIMEGVGPDKFAELGFELDGAFREGGFFNAYHPTDRVIVPLPMFLKPEGLEFLGDVGIPLSSANTVLQGEMPLLPGVGPLVTIPADQLLKHMDETQGVTYNENFFYRWVFPIGRPRSDSIAGSALEQVSPSWLRKVTAAMNEDSRGKQAQYMQLWRAMYTEAIRKGEDPRNIKPADIAEANKKLYALRIFASLTAPVQLEFRTDFQYFVDVRNKYKQLYGNEYWDKFIDDYGAEFAIYATSSSNSPVNAPPTNEGMDEFIEGRDLFNKYPDLGSLIFSPSAYTDDFNPDAFNVQFNLNMGPGNSDALREASSPEEQFRLSQERTGWREFRRFQSAIEAELYARGLHDIRQRGAEDLVAYKNQMMQDLANRNPEWWQAKFNLEQNTYPLVYQMQQIAGDPRFDNRPDFQGLRQYLVIRNMVTEQLDLYYSQQGGSRNLQAEENGALAQWFYSQVGQLRMNNPAFDDLYIRWLENDTMEQGGGGEPQ